MAYSNPATRSDTAKNSKGKVTAETASKTLIAANGDRVTAYITNNGSKDVWIALGTTAVAEEGLRLVKEGPPFRLEGYSGVVSVITKEGESVTTFVEV